MTAMQPRRQWPAPRLTVAMSVYNDAAYVSETITSVLAQTFEDFEFLIVDDGSSDGSGAILDHFAIQDPRICVFRQENRGLIVSLNRLVAEARAPLIARIDGDDVAHPERFARQVAWFDAHPDGGVLGTHAFDMDEHGQVFDDVTQRPLDHDGIRAALDNSSPLCHPSIMLRTDVIRAAGGYRAAYRHCEDFDLWLRLAQRTRLANLPEPLAYYRRSSGQISNRHAIAQQYGAAVALLADRARAEDKSDPTEGLDRLPDFDALDALFGPGSAAWVRARLAQRLIYSPEAMAGDGFTIIADHIRSGGAQDGLWRTVARLVRLGEPRRALALSVLLARAPRAASPVAAEPR
jgi:glycosyltransferase involved in cell wall biosynthesis